MRGEEKFIASERKRKRFGGINFGEHLSWRQVLEKQRERERRKKEWHICPISLITIVYLILISKFYRFSDFG